MVIDPEENDYPSKTYIRFAAVHQLQANLTRKSVSVYCKRSDSNGLVKFQPADCGEPDMQEEIDEALLESITNSVIDSHQTFGSFQLMKREWARKIETGAINEICTKYVERRLQDKKALTEKLKSLLR